MRRALVTVFNPNTEVLKNVLAISGQVDTIFICDNSVVDNTSLFSDIANCQYIYFGNNFGISLAFNRCLKNMDFKWDDDDYIIFFDQDSFIENGHIEQLIREYERIEEGYDIGCIGPLYINTHNDKNSKIPKKKCLADKIYTTDRLITSSLLCRYGKLKRIDFWNEDIFLDMADWDLCWRFIRNRMTCCITTNVIFRHAVGMGVKKIGPYRLKYGNPVRAYYQTRDGLYLLFKPYVPVRYRMIILRMLFVRPIIHFIFLDSRKERIYYVLKGIIDCLVGRKGNLIS